MNRLGYYLKEGTRGVFAHGLSSFLTVVIMIACLLIFAFSVSKRSVRPDYLVQTPLEKRKLSKRTILATVLILALTAGV